MSTHFTSPFGANANPFGPRDGNTAGGNVMHRVIEEDEADTVASPTASNFGRPAHTGFRSPFGGPFGGGDAPFDTPPTVRSPPNPDHYPPEYNFGRRTSVSAESLKPSADSFDTNWTPPFHEKTPDQLERLTKAIESNFLFSHLEDEQNIQVLGALNEKPIPAKDIKVCANVLRILSIATNSARRSSAKETPAISSMSWRRALSMSTSTAAARCNLGRTAWARRLAPSRPEAHLASLRSCTTPLGQRRSFLPNLGAHSGHWTA